jgi:capsid protein
MATYKFLDAAEITDKRPWSKSYNRLEDIRRAVNNFDWRVIVAQSRKIYGNMGIAKGAIAEKAMRSVGQAWLPKFEGPTNDVAVKAWADETKRWLVEEYYPTHDVRGQNFDFRTNLFLDSISIDRDGDIGILLTQSEDGWPMTQRIPAHRVGNVVGSYGDKVKEGIYKDRRIENGVIYNAFGRPIAYRIITDEDPGYEDIPASHFIHIYEPEWYDQSRGFPAFTHAVVDLQDMRQSQEGEQAYQKIVSSIGLIETNETGGPDVDNIEAVLITDPVSGEQKTVYTETMENGTVRYFRANSGSKLESITIDRPGELWENFWDRLTRSALLGINWSYTFWKPGELNSVSERSELDKNRTSVADRQSLLLPSAKRQVGYAVSVAIKEGILPAYPGTDRGGFLKWGFSLPPKMSIDNGRDALQRREDLKAGIRNMTGILGELGVSDIEEFYRERAYEIATKKRVAREVSESTGELVTVDEMGTSGVEQPIDEENNANQNL